VPAVEQYAALVQSSSSVQLVVQLVPRHGYVPQFALLPGAHVPTPLHSVPVTTLPLHVLGPHGVVGGANARQAPPPSHRPSALQESGKPGSGEQASCGSVPATTGAHAPSAAPVSVL
jgi:hypothetical protein